MANAAAVAVLAPLARVEVATAVALVAAAARHTAHGRRAAPSTHAHPPPQPTHTPSPATTCGPSARAAAAHGMRARHSGPPSASWQLRWQLSGNGRTGDGACSGAASMKPSLRSPRACCCSPPGECDVLKDEAEPPQRTLVPMPFQAAVDRHSPPAGRRHDGRRRRDVGPGHGPAAASRLFGLLSRPTN